MIARNAVDARSMSAMTCVNKKILVDPVVKVIVVVSCL